MDGSFWWSLRQMSHPADDTGHDMPVDHMATLSSLSARGEPLLPGHVIHAVNGIRNGNLG